MKRKKTRPTKAASKVAAPALMVGPKDIWAEVALKLKAKREELDLVTKKMVEMFQKKRKQTRAHHEIVAKHCRLTEEVTELKIIVTNLRRVSWTAPKLTIVRAPHRKSGDS